MTKNTQRAYMKGFRKVAEELAVDYKELYKYAQNLGWVADRVFSSGAGRMGGQALVNLLGKANARRAMHFMPLFENAANSPLALQKALRNLHRTKVNGASLI